MEKTKLFTEIYNKHYAEIYRFAYFQLGNKEDAEDIVSEAFLGAYTNLDKCNGNYRPWLYKIARNKIIDKYKSFENRNVIQNTTMTELAYEEKGFEKEIIVKDLFNKIVEKLNLIPKDQKEAILMRYVQELEYKEIATIMSRSENAVTTLISKGLKALRMESDDEKKSFKMLGAFIPTGMGDYQSKLFNNILKMEPTNGITTAGLGLKIASIIGVTVAIVGVSIGYVVISNNKNTENQKAVITSTPTVTATTTVEVSKTPTPSAQATPTIEKDYGNWSTYSYERHKLSFKYDPKYKVINYIQADSDQNFKMSTAECIDAFNQGLAAQKCLYVGMEIFVNNEDFNASGYDGKSNYILETTSQIVVNGIQGTKYVYKANPMPNEAHQPEAGSKAVTYKLKAGNLFYYFNFNEGTPNKDLLNDIYKSIESFKQI